MNDDRLRHLAKQIAEELPDDIYQAAEMFQRAIELIEQAYTERA